MSKFISHGRNYEVDSDGVISQTDAVPFTYDSKYVAIYDSPEYRKNSEILQAMRLGFIMGSFGRSYKIKELLDYGYGNGAFMAFAKRHIERVWGYDIPNTPVPEGCMRTNNVFAHHYDVVTMWDCMEHLTDPGSIINSFNCSKLCISLPFCAFHTKGQQWFDSEYRHRKPDEHLRHFNAASLQSFMNKLGWDMVSISNHEDLIRKNDKEDWNIISAAFIRINAY